MTGRKNQTEKNNENTNNLAKIMEEVGMEHGFDTVEAEFTAFRDFKLKWSRSTKWIEFQVSNYLEDAPEDVIRGLAKTVFAKIRGQDSDYPEEVNNWLTSPDFAENHRPAYLKRFIGISEGTKGNHIDLAECYDRLIESGLLKRDENLCIRWSRQNNKTSGRCSVLMKVVAINDILDREDMYEDAIDYALYSEICKVNQGYGESRKSVEDVKKEISRFKNQSDAEFRLATFGVRV